MSFCLALSPSKTERFFAEVKQACFLVMHIKNCDKSSHTIEINEIGPKEKKMVIEIRYESFC